MTASTLHLEFTDMRMRFHRTLVLSALLHALLFVVLAMGRPGRQLKEAVIEVTWLDQVVPVPVDQTETLPATPPAAVAKPSPEAARPGRRPTVADLAKSRPDIEKAVASIRPHTGVLAAMDRKPTDSALGRSALATMAPLIEKGRPASLNREETGSARVRELTRGPALGGAANGLVADLPHHTMPPAAATVGDDGASRQLDGALLTGPVANRPVVDSAMPVYPEWAKRKAAEASVTLHFTVLPDGRVKENVQVLKTGGYRDFDTGAVAALRAWRFAPLAGSEIREQWGTITFAFRLRD